MSEPKAKYFKEFGMTAVPVQCYAFTRIATLQFSYDPTAIRIIAQQRDAKGLVETVYFVPADGAKK